MPFVTERGEEQARVEVNYEVQVSEVEVGYRLLREEIDSEGNRIQYI